MTRGMDAELNRSIELFVTAVENASNLDIICVEQEDGKDIIVIENSRVSEECEGHQVTVDVSEIFAIVKDCASAQQFVDVINLDRKDVVLHGITRIVGYYSRTKNWNKSKIGELRDRQAGQYGTGKVEKKFTRESMHAVNSLS